MNLQSVSSLISSQPIIAAVVALILILFAIKKPKEFFKALAFVAALAVAAYVFMQAGDSMKVGFDSNTERNTKTEKFLEQ